MSHLRDAGTKTNLSRSIYLSTCEMLRGVSGVLCCAVLENGGRGELGHRAKGIIFLPAGDTFPSDWRGCIPSNYINISACFPLVHGVLWCKPLFNQLYKPCTYMMTRTETMYGYFFLPVFYLINRACQQFLKIRE